MVFIEPCEVEELLGSCCTCVVTPQGDDDGGDGSDGGDGGDGGGGDCGVPWGHKCEADGDCAGDFCCRDVRAPYTPWPDQPIGMLACGNSEWDCKRCWDCNGVVGDELCDSGDNYSQSNCTHGYGCPFECQFTDLCYIEGQCHCEINTDNYPSGCYSQCRCVPWSAWCMGCGDSCDSDLIPDYLTCSPYYPCGGYDCQGVHLLDTTLGACCQHEYVYGEGWIFTGCEEVMFAECKFGNWWGIHTTCGEFEDCCVFGPTDECTVDSDCPEDGDVCSDFGNCVTGASCDCQCLDSIAEWECCEETDGDGIWHIGETCESYDCEEDCPEEPECGPDVSCPPCYSCEGGTCVPECEESADCPTNRCCQFGCCIQCQDECDNDLQCDGNQCCKNGSCTYDCPECNVDGECPGEQECEDGECVDPPDPPDPPCENDGDCPQAKCCEGGECVSCDPDPPDPPCENDDDCASGLCCSAFGDCYSCPTGGCGCASPDGIFYYCDWNCDGPVPCDEGDDPDDYGQCYICYCCCHNEECPDIPGCYGG